MGYPLLQSQTAQPLVFLLVLSSDHITGATGKTATVTISKNGASFASPSGAVSEIGNGWYAVAGNATDEGTLGPLLLHATATGCDPVDDCFPVVAYSPLATSLGLSLAKTTNITGFNDIAATAVVSAGAITTASGAVVNVTTTATATNLTNAPTAGDFTSTMKTSLGTAVAASAVASVTGNVGGNVVGSVGSISGVTFPTNFGALLISVGGHISNVDTLTTYTGNTVQTGDSYVRIGATGSGLTSLAPSATALSNVQWTNTLATNLGTLAGHDPGATLGTSTLTQAQVTGGAYSVQSASCVLGDARIANLDAAVSTRSTYAGADTSGTATLLTRITASVALHSDAVALSMQIGTPQQSGSAVTLPANPPSGFLVTASYGTAPAWFSSGGGTVSGYATGQDPATLVLGALAASWVGAGTIGQAINAAGTAGDPLLPQVPGNYPTGSAGAALGKIGNGPVIATNFSPVGPSGQVTIYAGDDYSASDNRAIPFPSTAWPSLSGATFVVNVPGAGQTFTTGLSFTASGGLQTVFWQPTQAQTLTLTGHTGNMRIVATLADGDPVTLVDTLLIVK